MTEGKLTIEYQVDAVNTKGDQVVIYLVGVGEEMEVATPDVPVKATGPEQHLQQLLNNMKEHNMESLMGEPEPTNKARIVTSMQKYRELGWMPGDVVTGDFSAAPDPQREEG